MTSFLDALRTRGSLRAVELRPPPATLDRDASVEAWIDVHHGVRRLLASGRPVLFTDDAVGDREEESLGHLAANLGPGADLSGVVPFLTCKHPLEYCHLFARRAASRGVGGLTVTGGDVGVGPPRCVPRSRDLRARLRASVGSFPLGTWVNPFRDPSEQVGYLLDEEGHADYFLTQAVSHHDLGPLDRFLEEAARCGLEMPGLFGVFFYRSANRGTLERLSRFLPVPAEGLVREFEHEGVPPEEVCARTLRALRERGIEKVYVSNVGTRRAETRMREVEARLA